jgi:5-methylcytosine-specific restriction enzyme A
MTKVVDATGQEMNSRYSFGDEGGKKGIILESWSGENDNSKDYARALELILERLQQCKIPHLDVWVFSRDALNLFPAEERAIRIKLSGADVHKLRLEVGRFGKNLKADPSTGGGNYYKRILLHHPLLNQASWEAIASGTFSPDFFIELVRMPTSDKDSLEEKVAVLRALGDTQKPEGIEQPRRSLKEVDSIERSAAVQAWVLRQANGVCAACDKPAPFQKADGLPYLEIHHVKQLAAGGSDTPENAIAVCPNCHRALHYSHNKELLRNNILAKVVRLHDES